MKMTKELRYFPMVLFGKFAVKSMENTCGKIYLPISS